MYPVSDNDIRFRKLVTLAQQSLSGIFDRHVAFSFGVLEIEHKNAEDSKTRFPALIMICTFTGCSFITEFLLGFLRDSFISLSYARNVTFRNRSLPLSCISILL